MKQYLILLVLIAAFCNNVYSQQRITKSELALFKKNIETNPLLSDDDADFKVNSTGGKWSNESAVILAQKTTFEFDKKGLSAGKIIGRNIRGLLIAPFTLGVSIYAANKDNDTKILVEETERRKILLKDQFAVDQYSILYFRLSREGDAFNARVIKKDGSIEKVDASEAVRVSDIRSVPSLFRSYTDQRYTSTYRPSYFKIAVPDLEAGDIIEYEFKNINVEEFNSNPEYKEFDPIYYLCNRELPVAKQIIEVVAEDDQYFIGYKSIKGAPDFIEASSKGRRIYKWVDHNRDRRTDIRYVNDYLQLPSVKFQMVYARNKSKNFVWFKDENEMKQDMTEEALAEKVKLFLYHPEKMKGMGYLFTGASNTDKMVKNMYKSMKKKGITDAMDDDYVRKAYYTIRAQTLYSNWSDYAFAKIFSALLDEKKIDHEIVVTPYNTKTDLKKVAFTQELAWLIKYKNKYYCNPDEHLNPEEVPAYLAGNKALRLHFANEKKAVEHEVLPLADTLQNVVNTVIKASIDASNNSNVTINKTTEAKGLAKYDYIDEALALTPFMENDYRNYDGLGMWDGLDSKSEEKAMEEFNHHKKEWKEEKPLMMKEVAINEYHHNVEKYTSFRLVQDGRSYKKRDLKYEEAFILTDFKSTAGEDILIEVPALIGAQNRIKKEERTRSMPVDVRFPRTFNWNIIFTIPAGYSVKGLESLNKNIHNESGSFKSTAIIQNNTLIIDVQKMYKSKTFEPQKWAQLLTVQDAAYAFSQSKILLHKE